LVYMDEFFLEKFAYVLDEVFVEEIGLGLERF
jgi:hypothetical protein